jgi:uncharacterized pyridoxal phosphate-containing UPF0001 family protein
LDKFLLEIKKYDKINIVGFMTIGKDEDVLETEKAFQKLDELANKYQLPYRSMGMSMIMKLQLNIMQHIYELAVNLNPCLNRRNIWDLFSKNKKKAKKSYC